MEFTKGKWKVINAEDGVFIFSETNLIAEIEEYYNNTMPNALLISKAPEMLEMLKQIDDALDQLWQKDDKNILFDYLNGIDTKQLIKSATEL